MAGIVERKNKSGEIVSYKLMCCVGRDERGKQVWRTTTISKDDPRLEGLTPAKVKKELAAIKFEWDKEQKEEYLQTAGTKDKDKITLEQFVRKHWYADHVCDGQHTPSTIQFYEHISDDIIAYFGKQKLAAITTESVKRYIKYLRTQAKTKANKPYSASTIKHHYATLVQILDYARRLRYIAENPCDYLGAKEKPQKQAKEIDFLDVEDAKEYLHCLDTEPLYWRTLETLFLTTGLRRGEAVGLQWGDIDAKALTITVKRNVTIDKDAEDKIHIGTTKGKEARTVPISQSMYDLLAEHKLEQVRRYGMPLRNTGFVFCRVDDPYKPLYPTEPTRWQRKFVKRHNLPDVSPHDLRHTAATLALAGGANLKQIQALLGHKDVKTTMTFYAGVTAEQQRETVAGIEKILDRAE